MEGKQHQLVHKTTQTLTPHQEFQKDLGDKFSLITAFSREGTSKVYVQHRLKEHAKEVSDLLLQKAYFYVCGDAANMAREVNSTLAKILSEQRDIPESRAEEIVKGMRAANQYQVRTIPFTGAEAGKSPLARARTLTSHQEDVWS